MNFIFFIAILFNPGFIFYEAGIYLNQLKSLLADFDLNVINQIPEDMRWMVTHKYFSTFHHPESQLIVLAPIYIVEYLIRSTLEWVGLSAEFELKYVVSSIFVQFLTLGLSFLVLRKILSMLKFQYSNWTFVLFFLSTPLFYFATLQVHIVEVFALPFVTYLTYEYVYLKQNQKLENCALVGICSGVLLITKITYFPLIIFLYILVHRGKQNLNLQDRIMLWLYPIAFCLLHFLNNYIKTGQFWFITPPLTSFLYLKPAEVFVNVLSATILPGGLFFSSPALLLGLVGLVAMAIDDIKFNFSDKLFIGIWFSYIFFSQCFLVGYKTEDHWPGRINLSFLPFIALGYFYVYNRVKLKLNFKILVLVLCAFWHLILNLFYLAVIQLSSFIYAYGPIPDLNTFQTGLDYFVKTVGHNFAYYFNHLVLIFLFSSLFTVFGYLIYLKRSRKLLSYVGVAFLVCFTSITAANFYFAPRNIVAMKAAGFYKGLVVSNGVESYYLEFVAQYVKTSLLRADSNVKDKMLIAFRQYREKVSHQIVVNTPVFERALKTGDLDFYYWNKIEIEKEKSKALKH